MDHEQVVRNRLTEQYLLHELEDEARDEFEEHFFQCSECAADIRTASEFVERTKIIFARPVEQIATVRETKPKRVRFNWLSWLQPQFAASALAVLIAVVAYQNLVTLPRLHDALGQPQSLPWAAVAVGTYGAAGPTVTAQQGKSFLLFVRIPPDGKYARYTADLYNSGGGLECSLTTPAGSVEDQWPVLIPGTNRAGGSYRISVRGITASGETKDLGSAPFVLQIQN